MLCVVFYVLHKYLWPDKLDFISCAQIAFRQFCFYSSFTSLCSNCFRSTSTRSYSIFSLSFSPLMPNRLSKLASQRVDPSPWPPPAALSTSHSSSNSRCSPADNFTIWCCETPRSTLLNYIKFTDRRILRLQINVRDCRAVRLFLFRSVLCKSYKLLISILSPS